MPQTISVENQTLTDEPVPDDVEGCWVTLIGGGAPGHSGNGGGDRTPGGYGGGGGARVSRIWIPRELLGSTYSTVWGLGGTTPGGNGDASSFVSGSLSLSAAGGTGRIGGVATGSGVDTTGKLFNGSDGGDSNAAGTANANGAGAGGGGGGYVSSPANGGKGGNSATTTGGAGGTGNGGAGATAPDSAAGNGGAGGGGGAGGWFAVAGNGGRGGKYGGGGGGGGSGVNGQGVGGAGGDGYLLVEWAVSATKTANAEFAITTSFFDELSRTRHADADLDALVSAFATGSRGQGMSANLAVAATPSEDIPQKAVTARSDLFINGAFLGAVLRSVNAEAGLAAIAGLYASVSGVNTPADALFGATAETSAVLNQVTKIAGALAALAKSSAGARRGRYVVASDVDVHILPSAGGALSTRGYAHLVAQAVTSASARRGVYGGAALDVEVGAPTGGVNGPVAYADLAVIAAPSATAARRRPMRADLAVKAGINSRMDAHMFVGARSLAVLARTWIRVDAIREVVNVLFEDRSAEVLAEIRSAAVAAYGRGAEVLAVDRSAAVPADGRATHS